MASYTEIKEIVGGPQGDVLKSKIEVAMAVAAETIRNEDGATNNHANRLIWAKEALNNPGQKAREMLWALLAQNAASDVSTIVGASDAAIQINVDAAVDIFATG